MATPLVKEMARRSGGPFALLGQIIGDGGIVADGAVVIDGGRIVSIDRPAVAARLPARRFAAAFVAPGFVDLQMNGGFGFEVGEDPDALCNLAARLPATGVTSFLPTLVSRNEPAYQRAFGAYDAAVGRSRSSTAARMLGLHLEGPLLSRDRVGAHDPAAVAAADATLLQRLCDPARVRLVTLAPERAGALSLIAELRAGGVLVALGHTDASFEVFTAGVEAGAVLATHLFNAMSPFHHRAPGAIGAVLTDDRLVATIIADGVHCHPAALRLAMRVKGVDGLALVTDAIAGAGLGPGPSQLAGQPVTLDGSAPRLADGTLAGSALTMDQAIRNLMSLGGSSAGVAIHLAAGVPGRVLETAFSAASASEESAGEESAAEESARDLGGLGRLRVGAAADIVLLDDGLHPLATFIGGALAYPTDRGSPYADLLSADRAP